MIHVGSQIEVEIEIGAPDGFVPDGNNFEVYMVNGHKRQRLSVYKKGERLMAIVDTNILGAGTYRIEGTLKIGYDASSGNNGYRTVNVSNTTKINVAHKFCDCNDGEDNH